MNYNKNMLLAADSLSCLDMGLSTCFVLNVSLLCRRLEIVKIMVSVKVPHAIRLLNAVFVFIDSDCHELIELPYPILL